MPTPDYFQADAFEDAPVTDLTDLMERMSDQRRREILTPEQYDAEVKARAEANALRERRMLDSLDDPPPPSTWAALDLSAYLEADADDEKPTICLLPSGKALFYDAAVNGVAGEPAAGKSWVAFLAAAQEMRQGHPVAFVDLEDTPRRTVRRLYAVGASRDEVSRLFRYVRPEESYNQLSRDALDAVTDGVRLVVIDSTGEALSLQGAKSNADEDVTAWFTALPKHLAKRGLCVLLLDHVAKVEGGRWPIGSQRKLAAISGVQYTLGLGKAFSRDEPGWSELIVSKDRHGTYYQGEKPALLEVLADPGSFGLSDHDGRESERAAPSKKPSKRDRALDVLTNAEGPLTSEQVQARSGMHRTDVSTALNGLRREELVTCSTGTPKFWSLVT
jgi:hypothetical protein